MTEIQKPQLSSGIFFQLIFDYEFIGEKLLWFHENLDGVQPNVYEETEDLSWAFVKSFDTHID